MFQLSGEETEHKVRFETIPKPISEVEHKSREDLKSEIDDAVNGQFLAEKAGGDQEESSGEPQDHRHDKESW